MAEIIIINQCNSINVILTVQQYLINTTNPPLLSLDRFIIPFKYLQPQINHHINHNVVSPHTQNESTHWHWYIVIPSTCSFHHHLLRRCSRWIQSKRRRLLQNSTKSYTFEMEDSTNAMLSLVTWDLDCPPCDNR